MTAASNSGSQLHGSEAVRAVTAEGSGLGAVDAPVIAPWTVVTERQRWELLAVLFLLSTSQYFDHSVISVLFEPIKQEFHASDTMLGLLGGFSFSLFYAVFGLPIARWADRGNRRTIITLALAAWSVMTLLCAAAHTLFQLILARVGVGAGEAGGFPPAQSLIADYFPAERRAMAVAIFTGGATAGNMLGIGLGGYIAAMYGWRAALLFGGIFGLILVAVVRLGLREPRLELGFPGEIRSETISETFKALWRKRSFRYALSSFVLYSFFVQGAVMFVPSFLIRSLHASLAEVSVTYGTVFAAGSLIGTIGGGRLAQVLGARDIRWLAWLMALACGLSGLAFTLAFAVHDLWTFMGFIFVASVVLSAGVPSIFTAVHAICGNLRRATAVALVYFSAVLVGGGLGPLVGGMLSDALTSAYGTNGLRYALMVVTTVALAAGGLSFKSGYAMPADLED